MAPRKMRLRFMHRQRGSEGESEREELRRRVNLANVGVQDEQTRRANAQLVNTFNGSIPEGAKAEEWRKEMFGKVRILVTGKSGSGKSTLLRLVIGEEGPRSMAADGAAGEQDINKEYHYKLQHGIPLVFHDTNGLSVNEGVNFNILRDFMETHQCSDDFSEHVHVVWYVASASDNRLKDDGGLLRLISSFKVPMLFVLTHTDELARENVIKERMQNLCELIDECSVADLQARKSMKESIITLGNYVEFNLADNRIIVHHHDEDGLKLLSSQTADLLRSDEMKATWAASQAVDMNIKLDLSAKRIANYAKRAALSAPAAIVPFTDTVKIGLLFNEICASLCAIWGVPEIVREVLEENLLRKERMDSVLYIIANDVVTLGGVGIAAVTTILTAGLGLAAVLPPVLAWLGGSGLVNARSVPILAKGFALQVLVNILFIKCRQGSSKHRWDPALTKSQCQDFCDDLLRNAALTNEVKEFAQSSHSCVDTVFRKQIVQDVLREHMVHLSECIWRDRPTSFASVSRFFRTYN